MVVVHWIKHKDDNSLINYVIYLKKCEKKHAWMHTWKMEILYAVILSSSGVIAFDKLCSIYEDSENKNIVLNLFVWDYM